MVGSHVTGTCVGKLVDGAAVGGSVGCHVGAGVGMVVGDLVGAVVLGARVGRFGRGFVEDALPAAGHQRVGFCGAR